MTKPVWSEPYTDANSGNKAMGVSMPIYYYENSIRQILGVANIAVPMSTILSYNIGSE